MGEMFTLILLVQEMIKLYVCENPNPSFIIDIEYEKSTCKPSKC